MLLFGDLEILFALQKQIFSMNHSGIEKYFKKNYAENESGDIDETDSSIAAR